MKYVGCYDQAFERLTETLVCATRPASKKITTTHNRFFLEQIAEARRLNEKYGLRQLQEVQ
jgi:hypothetical protein